MYLKSQSNNRKMKNPSDYYLLFRIDNNGGRELRSLFFNILSEPVSEGLKGFLHLFFFFFFSWKN